MKRSLSSVGEPAYSGSGTVGSHTSSPVAATSQDRSTQPTVLNAEPRSAGDSIAPPPVEALPLVADRIPDAPGLVAWTSLNKTHLQVLRERRDRLRLHASLLEFRRTQSSTPANSWRLQRGHLIADLRCASIASSVNGQPSKVPLFSPVLNAAVVWMSLAALRTEQAWKGDAPGSLRNVGVQSLTSALNWLDDLTEASPPSAAGPDATPHWTDTLQTALHRFWTALPNMTHLLAAGLLEAPAQSDCSALTDALLSVFSERLHWQAAQLKPALADMCDLIKAMNAPCEQKEMQRLRLLLLDSHCNGGLRSTENLLDYLTPLAGLQPAQKGPFMLTLAQHCASLDASGQALACKFDFTNILRKESLRKAIEQGRPLHHPLMSCVDLFLFGARTQLALDEALRVTEPLHDVLLAEIRTLKRDLQLLPLGKAQSELKFLLSQEPRYWSDIWLKTHTPATANRDKFIDPAGHALCVFAPRVQRLCSVLRNLLHLMQADPLCRPSLELRGRLRELFAEWPTKPGKKTLLNWLDGGGGARGSQGSGAPDPEQG